MRSFSVLTASSLDLLILHVIELILHSIELAAAKLPDVCVCVCVCARARACVGGVWTDGGWACGEGEVNGEN